MNYIFLFLVCLSLVGCGPQRIFRSKSPDRLHLVEIWKHRDQQFLKLDGQEQRAFDGIAVDGLSWSDDSRRFAYPAKTAAGWFVVVDGQPNGPWSGIGEIVWSPDGLHYAYSAEKRRFWVVVHDGTKIGTDFDAIMEHSIVFSPNGQRFGYVVQDGRVMRAVVDGELGPKFDGVGRLGFSADNLHIVYLARRVDTAFLVIDGRLSAPYESIADIVLSPSGFHWAILARFEGAWHAIVDDVAGPAFDSIDSPVFSSTNQRMAYAAWKGKTAFVIVDGQEGAAFEEILPSSVVFDAQGTHMAYAARRGTSWRVVVDGREEKEYAKVSAPVLAADSVAYVAERVNEVFVVLNGVEGSHFDRITDLALSADGKHHGYVGVKNQDSFIVIDAVAQKYDLVVDGTFVLSGHGQHWGCLIGDPKQRKLFLTIDGTRQIPMDTDDWIAAFVPNLRTPDLSAVFDQKNVVRRWLKAEIAKMSTTPGDSSPLPSTPQ